MTSLDDKLKEESSFLKKIWNSLAREMAPYLLAFSMATGLGCSEKSLLSRPGIGNYLSDAEVYLNPDAGYLPPINLDVGYLLPMNPDAGRPPPDQEIDAGEVVKDLRLRIDAGRYHTCALKEDGTITCWGYNFYGQANSPEGTFTQVSAGYEHTCALKESGEIECWGNDEHGQSSPPEGTFTQVSAGYWHTCGLRESREVDCWGRSLDGDVSYSFKDTFTQISAGGEHSCGLRSDRTYDCWGYRDYTATGGFFSSTFHSMATYIQVSAGAYHTCAIMEGGWISCWEGLSREIKPQGRHFVQVDAGGFHTCAIREDGAVVCWEERENHEGDYGQSDAPEGTFTQVSAGGAHTCALDIKNNIQCWGNDEYGQSTPPPL